MFKRIIEHAVHDLYFHERCAVDRDIFKNHHEKPKEHEIDKVFPDAAFNYSTDVDRIYRIECLDNYLAKYCNGGIDLLFG